MKVVASIAYEKRKQIGVGQGMNSEVFVAHDPQLGGEIVVKEVEKAKFIGLPTFFVEAQAMFKSTHENIVPIAYACETPTHVCIAMPYFKRGSLTDRIETHSLRLSDIIKLGQGVLTGVAQIHLSGFVHFDIKPSNVLFSDCDVPMVADFGQARPTAAGVVGRLPPIYQLVRPPELLTASGVGLPQGDVFQVGLLLYRAVNGERHYAPQVPSGPNFDSDLRQRLATGKFPDRDRFMPHVPKHLRTVIRKALKVDPTERHATAIDFADALSNVKLGLDWHAEWLANDQIRWTAGRQGQPSLVVELLEDGSEWRVEIRTMNAGMKPRAKNTADWRRKFTRDAAFSHLKVVFENLAA